MEHTDLSCNILDAYDVDMSIDQPTIGGVDSDADDFLSDMDPVDGLDRRREAIADDDGWAVRAFLEGVGREDEDR